MRMPMQNLASLFVFAVGLVALAVVAAPSEQLQNYSAKIEQARTEGATLLAPVSLRLAETELRRAHQVVRQNSRNPLAVEQAIAMANYRIEELRRVLDVVQTAGYKMAEERAVAQVREIFPNQSPTISKHEAVD